jgi:prepilin-type N-terminal cleavage/methylation domain-containing protein
MRIAPSQCEMFRTQSMRRHRRGSRSAGFSLIELAVVLAIVAAMSLVAVPWFVKISQRQTLQSAGREIAVALTAARMKAVKRNAQVAFVVSGGAPIEFQTIEPAPPAPTPTPLPSILRLPATAARFQGPTPAPIIFGGDGRVAAGVAIDAVIEGPIGMRTPNAITIRTNANGRVEVITPVNWQ